MLIKFLLSSGLFFSLALPLGAVRATVCDSALEKLSQEWIRGVETSFEALLPNFGFASYDAFVAELRKSDDPYISAAVQLFDESDLELAIHIGEGREANPEVLQSGIKNAYESNDTSSGYINWTGRKTLEASLAGSAFEFYAKLPDQLRPKYGVLRPSWRARDKVYGTRSLRISAEKSALGWQTIRNSFRQPT